MQRQIIVQVALDSKTQLKKQCEQKQGYNTAEFVKLSFNREGTAKLYKSDKKKGSTKEQEKTY